MPHSELHVLTKVEISALMEYRIEIAYKLSSLCVRSQHSLSKCFWGQQGGGVGEGNW